LNVIAELGSGLSFSEDKILTPTDNFISNQINLPGLMTQNSVGVCFRECDGVQNSKRDYIRNTNQNYYKVCKTKTTPLGVVFVFN
jgi:hypothetical protein